MWKVGVVFEADGSEALEEGMREREGTVVSRLRNSTSAVGFLWIALSVVLQSFATVLGKMAGNFSAAKDVHFIVVNPWYACSIVALALQGFCWLMALRRFFLSFAYPFMSLVFPLNLFLAGLFFHEFVGWNHLFGTVLIVLGVGAISRGG